MNVDGTCKEKECQANEVKVGTSECRKCSDVIAGCSTCSSTTTCDKCIDDKAENKIDKCVCENGMNADGTCK